MASSTPSSHVKSPKLDLAAVDQLPASSGDGSGDVKLVNQMKHFVEQIIIICSGMLSVLQQSSDGGTATATGEPKNEEQAEFLKQKLRELVSMNVNWQQTHQRQEQTIAELVEKNRQLELHLQTSGAPSGLSEHQQAEIDRLLIEQKQKYELLLEEKSRIDEENKRLKSDLEATRELNSVLELQLVTNHEDFNSERRDRERTQGQLDELQRELETYRGRLHQLPYPVGQYGGAQINPIVPRLVPQHMPVFRGRYVADVYDGHLDQTDCVADGPKTTTPPPPTGLRSRGSSPQDEQLQCPNCRRKFTKDQHEQLMDHMDKCDGLSFLD